MIPTRASRWMTWGLTLGGLLVAGAAWVTSARWIPERWDRFRRAPSENSATAKAGRAASVDDHAGHEELTSIELTEAARKTLDLQVGPVELRTFVRTITVPGVVAERPGRTKVRIVAPMTGIVTKVHVLQGEAIRPGRRLFDLRLTHEDLLQPQVEFLKMVEELDVVNKEIERLRPAFEKGVIPEKTILDRKYEQQKLQASLKSQRESLLLHGLSEKQTNKIQQSRTLHSEHTVFAPGQPLADKPECTPDPLEKNGLLVAEELKVETGRFVNTGDELVTLADYSELFVQGNAFEQDGQLIADVLRAGRKVSIRVENHTSTGALVPDLDILYLSDQIDLESRTLHFYLRLPNEKVRDAEVDGHCFINWRFKPGQRTHLLVPVEEWPQRIVLPADAVVLDGVESYVFQQNGDHFDRRAVQVEYRDRFSVVIVQDGSLSPGDIVATSGAQQLLLALKNKAGGGADPHAGHNH